MSQPTVLVIEDDAPIRRGLVDALRYAEYEVLECADGREALGMALELKIDLVLLDVMLPGMDGFSILDKLRESRPTLPIIMVTARGAESDRVRGLKTGADDYVVKPFSAHELLARVEAVLRRSPERPRDVHKLRVDDIIMDLDRREVSWPDDRTKSLSDREVDILQYLAGNRDRAVDRKTLLQHVWRLNPKGLNTRTVDMHIARLREKLEDDPNQTRIIETVRGKGYMLAAQVEVIES